MELHLKHGRYLFFFGGKIGFDHLICRDPMKVNHVTCYHMFALNMGYESDPSYQWEIRRINHVR